MVCTYISLFCYIIIISYFLYNHSVIYPINSSTFYFLYIHIKKCPPTEKSSLHPPKNCITCTRFKDKCLCVLLYSVSVVLIPGLLVKNVPHFSGSVVTHKGDSYYFVESSVVHLPRKGLAGIQSLVEKKL